MSKSLGRRLRTSADDRALPVVVKEGAHKTQAVGILSIYSPTMFPLVLSVILI